MPTNTRLPLRFRRFINIALVIVVIACLPLVIRNAYYLALLQTVAYNYIAVLGLMLLVGYSGQISIGQGGIYAIGAYTSAVFVTQLGLSFWVGAAAALVLSCVVGAIIALPTLRTKGFYLALVTLAFAVGIQAVAVNWRVLGGSAGISGITRPSVFGYSFDDRAYFYLTAVTALAVALLVKRLRSSHYGRLLLAVSSNEDAAAVLGINVYRWKVVAFVLASFCAGLSGVFFAHQGTFINSENFGIDLSLFFLISVLLGGVRSIFGTLIATAILVGAPGLFAPLYDYHRFFHGGVLLLIVFVLPKGIGELLRTPSWLSRRPASSTVSKEYSLPNLFVSEAARDEKREALRLEQVTKNFGGVRALENVSLRMGYGAIYTLIGPNGAGKTTLINVASGFSKPSSAEGAVYLNGVNITGEKPHGRAKKGLVRTFQGGKLFEALSVIENVEVGFHLSRRRSVFAGLLGLRRPRHEEEQLRERAMALLAFVGMQGTADMEVTDLPAGHRRLVEIARALATNSQMLILDEPASGLNSIELEELGRTLKTLRARGMALLVVEHHIGLVMDISDHVFVLENGTLIADGPPTAVAKNKAVVKAYLGAAGAQGMITGPASRPGSTTEKRASLLRVTDVVLCYDGNEVLHNINLEVEQGNIIVLVGANGAGKSSILKAITGLAIPTSGRITFDGQDITRKRPHELMRCGLSLAPEGHPVFPFHTVADNIELGVYKKRELGNARFEQAMQQAFELFPQLESRRNQLAGTLSGGEQQMLSIAKALVSKPRLLILDEPSIGLAPAIVELIFKRIGELNGSGLTVLMSEQLAAAALGIAHRGYVIQNGRVVFQGTGRELLDSTELLKGYLGP